MEYILIIIIILMAIFWYLSKKKKPTPEDPESFEDPEGSEEDEIVIEPDAPASTAQVKTANPVGPYRKRQLLTKSEYTFYGILKKKCDAAHFLICPKVRLEDFVLVTSKNEKMKYRGYIKSRHVDFLICDSKLRILAGIELDDKSHRSEKAKKADTFKNELYKTIGLPLYRIKVGDNYNDKIDEFIKAESEKLQPAKSNTTKPLN